MTKRGAKFVNTTAFFHFKQDDGHRFRPTDKPAKINVVVCKALPIINKIYFLTQHHQLIYWFFILCISLFIYMYITEKILKNF